MIQVLSLLLSIGLTIGSPFPEDASTTLATVVPSGAPGPAHSVPATYPSGGPPGPNGLPPCMPPPPPPGAQIHGQGPPPPGFQGPPPPGHHGPPPPGQGPPPPQQELPICPPTVVSGHCGGVTYFWDTATPNQEPEAFKKCFYGDGPVSALCNGKEYTWDPAKDSKPEELAACEKEFAARQKAGIPHH